MKIYLAGNNGRRGILKKVIEEGLRKDYNMNLYLSGGGIWKYAADGNTQLNLKGANTVYVLESYAYINSDKVLIPLIPYFKGFMLDSGAFTFLQKGNGNVEFNSHLVKYANFIKKHNISQFFELDVDAIVGYPKVVEYRKKLEDITGKRCIPVWHRNRGKEEFLKLCEEYNYVALGGIAIKEIKRTEYKYFSWFIKEAHKRNTKIHALGFTNLKGIRKYHFDSVDSSSWTTGNRFGHVYKFNGKTLEKFNKPEGMRVKTKEVAINNFVEWVKFAKYAENHL